MNLKTVITSNLSKIHKLYSGTTYTNILKRKDLILFMSLKTI